MAVNPSHATHPRQTSGSPHLIRTSVSGKPRSATVRLSSAPAVRSLSLGPYQIQANSSCRLAPCPLWRLTARSPWLRSRRRRRRWQLWGASATGCVVPDVEAARRCGERSVRGLVLSEGDQRLVPFAAIRAVLEV